MTVENHDVEPFAERLRRFLDTREVNIFGGMTMWAQNELLPQIRAVMEPGFEALLFVGCHTFLQTFMEKTYGLRGKEATREFLVRFMDEDDEHNKFSVISDQIHEMRNVMAHQMYSSRTQEIAFNYLLNVGWDHVDQRLHINPRRFADQFVAALNGGRLRRWRDWTTPELLARQKWLFIADWLHLAPKDPLRQEMEAVAKLADLDAIRAAETPLREKLAAKYGV